MSQGLYTHISNVDPSISQTDISSAFQSLNKTFKIHTKSWWEVASPERYHKQGLYHDLRIPTLSNSHRVDINSMVGWERLLMDNLLQMI